MVFAVVRSSAYNILQGNSIQIIKDDIIKSLIDGERQAMGRVFAGIWGIVHAAYWCQASFSAF